MWSPPVSPQPVSSEYKPASQWPDPTVDGAGAASEVLVLAGQADWGEGGQVHPLSCSQTVSGRVGEGSLPSFSRAMSCSLELMLKCSWTNTLLTATLYLSTHC